MGEICKILTRKILVTHSPKGIKLKTQNFYISITENYTFKNKATRLK